MPEETQSCTVRSATNPRVTLSLSRRDAPAGLVRIEIDSASIIYVQPEDILLAVRTITEPS